MLIETMAIWLALCAVLSILAYWSRSLPLAIVSSIGIIVTAFQSFDPEDPDLFILGMLLMIAFAIPLTIRLRGRN